MFRRQNIEYTHILNQLSWKLLGACAEAPRTSHYLYDLLAAEPESAELDNETLEDSLQGHLEQLQQLDLLQAIHDRAIH